ncbi:hypothetical protein LOD99_5150 [Oopsacas minuta]|uniref:Uncharacterized protein n=1 Tax=Oopsacas minuta TaxID=111878 RepID=A0AAV7JRC7_9METZ|nr:hypothetical protein LOD99_5150 [Oopsacas minuta]
MATLTEQSEIVPGHNVTIVTNLQQDPGNNTSELYTSVLAPVDIDGEGSGLRARVPNTISLDDATQIQQEYEAPFKDLINQNPIKSKDFKHPPSWFQNSPFSHNLRLAIGIFPALFVVLSLSGKGLLATLCIGALAIYFTLNFSLPKHSLLVCLITIISAEVANFFSILPLIWRSFMNTPLLSLTYSFIIGLGGWTLLQFPHLRVTEPAMCVLIEELMFVLVPPLLFLVYLWACLFLFSIHYIGTISCFVMSAIAFLYFVPITSSFYRPGSTKFPVVILTRPMTAILTAGSLMAPCGVEFICNIYKVLILGEQLQPIRLVWVFSLQIFLLTLLSKARLFWFLGGYTMGNSSPLVYVRAVSGCVAVVTGSLIFSKETFLINWSVSLPILLVLAGLFATIVSAAEKRSARLKLVCVLLSIFYVTASYFLPWRLEYSGPLIAWGIEFSLQLFLLLLLCTAILSVVLMYKWRNIPSPLYLLHLSGILLCEYWLVREELYSYWMFLSTSAAGMMVTDRLHRSKSLKLTVSWVSASLHLTKLVWMLPDLSHTNIEFSQTSALPSFLPGFVIALLTLGALRFDTELVGIKRLAYAGIMLLTLLLSQQSLIKPALSLAYINSPTPADLLAITLTAFCLSVGLLLARPDQMRGQATKKLLAGVVIVCGGCSTLLNSFKPSLEISELLSAIHIILGMESDISPLREKGLLLAVSWRLVIDWSLFSIISFVGIHFFLSHILEWKQRFRFIQTTCLVSGWLIGLRIALLLGPFPNLLWQIYGLSGSVTSYLLYRAVVASPQQPPCYQDILTYFVLLGTFVLQFVFAYVQIQFRVNDIKCSQFWVINCLVIAVGYKLKQQVKKYALGGDETSGFMEIETTYYPLIANFSCFVAYISLIFSPFQHEIELSFLFGSVILLLMQNDNLLISSIHSENRLWPSLAAFDLFLHAYYFAEILILHRLSWLTIFEVIIISINIPFHFNFINAYKMGDKIALVSISTIGVPLNFIIFTLYSIHATFFIASLACCFILQVAFWHRRTVLEALDG